MIIHKCKMLLGMLDKASLTNSSGEVYDTVHMYCRQVDRREREVR